MATAYAKLALKEGNRFICYVHYAPTDQSLGSTNRHGSTFNDIDDAVSYLIGSEHAELYVVDEVIPGEAMEVKVADIIVGEWFIHEETELTMAKVKEVKKEAPKKAKAKADKAALDDLIGNPSKKVEKGKIPNPKAAKEKGTRTKKAAFEPTQKIRILKKYEGSLRPGSNLELSLKVLKSGMTVGDWNKARAKAGVENVGFGYLHKLVNEDYVKVV